MKITQVRFPCGRIGLELDDGKSYRYYYNGDFYDRNRIEVLNSVSGEILNLDRLEEISVDKIMLAASTSEEWA